MKCLLLKRIFLVLLLFQLLSCKSSQEKQEAILSKIPDPKTLNETFVSDPDQILNPSTVYSLNQTLKELDISGKAHIDVVIVKSIGDEVPKDIAYKLFNTWKIGRADTNNGLLIFLVLDQRRIEFETGVGLEPVLTDMICADIQRKYMIPYLKQGNYDQAIVSAISPIIEVLNTESYNFNVEPENLGNINVALSEPHESEHKTSNSFFNSIENIADKWLKNSNFVLVSIIIFSSLTFFSTIITVVKKVFFQRKKKSRLVSKFLIILFQLTIILLISSIITAVFHINFKKCVYVIIGLYLFRGFLLHIRLLIILILAKRKDRDKRYNYLLKYKETFKYSENLYPISFIHLLYKKLCKDIKHSRYDPYVCENCKSLMKLNKNKNLSKGQSLEEKINSVEYDSWECISCKTIKLVKYTNIYSKAKECEKCHYRTNVLKKTYITQKATTSSSGSGYELYECKFCHEKEEIEFVIPKDSTRSSRSSYSIGSSRSSGSSSRSSSGGYSSSSGGRSGGGGAGSSW
ncbi:TPM domain-containing protein [Apibacter muscae]|uniref:TPM domain-containing protein n=1 Tax=Apibacter muscae TaxID=2509004 RepID=UPI0011AD3273|nr:TPM domain-containing protein [Apibacter muscae]TWP29519.1 TPM domain-containing protein [Apibacter muscae]